MTSSSDKSVLPTSGSEIGRRGFLGWLAASGAGAAAAGCGLAQPRDAAMPDDLVRSDSPTPTTEPAPPRRDPVPEGRTLVVVELSGGSDGLAMLQPFESSLEVLRPELVAPPGELVDAGRGMGWHPALAEAVPLGLGALTGVGSFEPSFSHFEMEQRWWRGESVDASAYDTGFLGRLCDELDVGAPLTGVSFGPGSTPALVSRKAVTASLGEPADMWLMRSDDARARAVRSSLAAMAGGDSGAGPRSEAAQRGLGDAMAAVEVLSDLDGGPNERWPWSGLSQQLRWASSAIERDVGVRVIHVQVGGFDTHTGQEWRYRQLMEEVAEGLIAFTSDLERIGRRDDTLIVTTSEFGRRVRQNESGTDHGGAGTALVCGAGITADNAEVIGELPDLENLNDGNLVASTSFEDFYATVADRWFGVDPQLVLPAGATPVDGLI